MPHRAWCRVLTRRRRAPKLRAHPSTISAIDITQAISYIDIAMNQRQRRTRDRIFERPNRSDIRWEELASLMRALGADEIERSGSRVRFVLNGRVLNLHRRTRSPG